MGLFGNDAPQSGLNLGVTGAPAFSGYGQTGVGLPVAQQNGFSQQN